MQRDMTENVSKRHCLVSSGITEIVNEVRKGYPELENVLIRTCIEELDISFALVNHYKGIYRLRVDPIVAHFEKDALIGLVAHELAHVVHLERLKKKSNIILILLLNSYRMIPFFIHRWVERTGDRILCEHGFSKSFLNIQAVFEKNLGDKHGGMKMDEIQSFSVDN